MGTRKSPRAHSEEAARDNYHHGALRAALIAATDAILSERGAEGFSLREAARRAGVSPGAPAHHFRSAAGLLTEVAIAGFSDLTRELRKARNAVDTPVARLRRQGEGYVRFALAQPGRFQVMFRHDLLLEHDERLDAAGKAALGELEITVHEYLGPHASERQVRAQMLSAWSTVHGFAHLALDGKLTSLVESGSPERMLIDALSAAFPATPSLPVLTLQPIGKRIKQQVRSPRSRP